MTPVFAGGAARGFFEVPVKIRKISIAAGKGDFGYFFLRGGEGLAGRIDAKLAEIFDGAKAYGFFKTAHEVALAKVGESRKLRDGNIFMKVFHHILQGGTDAFSIVCIRFFLA